jgi:polyribonucleotide nucleotidyltransferase
MLALQIDPSKKGMVIGSGGRTINSIKETAGCSVIDIDEEGNISITALTPEGADLALSYINLVVNDPEPGQVFR